MACACWHSVSRKPSEIPSTKTVKNNDLSEIEMVNDVSNHLRYFLYEDENVKERF